jgi:hypothetical protein
MAVYEDLDKVHVIYVVDIADTFLIENDGAATVDF